MIIDAHYHFRDPALSPGGEVLRATAKRVTRIAAACGWKGSLEGIEERVEASFAPPPEEVLDCWLQEFGVDRVVIFAVDNAGDKSLTEERIMAWNRAAAEASRARPGRVTAFASIDPRRPRAAELLEECLGSWGMRGLKWHCDWGFLPQSPEAYALLEVAQKHAAPLVTHTSPLPTPFRSEYAQVRHLADIEADFPDLTIIAAHMNYYAWREYVGAAYLRDNLYGDLALWPFMACRNWDAYCRALREIADWVGADKIIFGSDAPVLEAFVNTGEHIRMVRDLAVRAPADAAFTQEEVDLILGGNARRILGI